MDILIFALVALIIVAVVIWLIDLVPLPNPLNMICKVAAVVIALILIIQRAGVL